jgi:hypothetical protein
VTAALEIAPVAAGATTANDVASRRRIEARMEFAAAAVVVRSVGSALMSVVVLASAW